MFSIALLALSPILLLAVCLLHYAFKAYLNGRAFHAINPHIAYYTYYFPLTGWLIVLGLLPDWLAPVPHDWMWKNPYKLYQQCKKDVFAVITPGSTEIMIADADLCKTITSDRLAFPKPIELYAVLAPLGQNVITSEHEEWKRHRRVAAPAFAEKHNVTVHETTRRLVHEIFASWESEQVKTGNEEILVNVSDSMMKLALYVISGAGFGMDLKWDDDKDNRWTSKYPGHEMSFKQALQEMLSYLRLRLLVPKSLDWLPYKPVANMNRAFREYNSYISEQISLVRSKSGHGVDADRRKGHENLLASFVEASDMSGENAKLTTDELKSNIFFYIIAGHETTAHTLSFAFSLLSLNPDVQERLYEEVTLVFGKEGPIEFKRLSELPFTAATINETLRLYAPVEAIPKVVGSDVDLGDLTLKQGTQIRLHTIGLHYNPKYWGEDASEFRPSRWFGNKDFAESAKMTAAYLASQETVSDGTLFNYHRDAFIPFSDGARGCLGKRFAIVEMLVAVAEICRRYTIRLPPGVSAETLLKATSELTVQQVHPANLLFRKR